MTSKLRIRIGEVEIEYEGTEEFLKEELPELLKTAMELRKATGPAQKYDKQESSGSSATKVGTTKTIAAGLKVNSGQDLLLAAALKLTVGDMKETFSRQELLDEMKKGGSYYKKSYSNNLTSYLDSAINAGDLNETANNTYGLKAATQERLEKQLADA